jgi:RNA polymerase sigma-70 factor (ECF subfamily)
MSEEHLDREYVERCLGGDLDAFGMLIDRYQAPVFRIVLNMVGNYEDAKEVLQQVFMKAFEHLASFDRDRRFFSWIYRMAVNESINHIRARRPVEPLTDEARGPLWDPARSFEERERDRRVRDAVTGLNEIYRPVVILRHFAHCSYTEIAEVLNLPEKTVKSRLFTARQLLRDALTADGHVN